MSVDNSFSMRAGTRLADAKRDALSCSCADEAARRSCAGAAIGAQAHVLTQATQDARHAAGGGCGDRAERFARQFRSVGHRVRSIAESEHAPIELHLFSDLQKTNMPPSFTEMVLPRNVSLVLHPVASDYRPNWACGECLRAASGVGPAYHPRAGGDRRIRYAAATRTVSFLVNGKTIATRQVDVPASGRATAEIDSLELPYGFSRCSVKIDAARCAAGGRRVCVCDRTIGSQAWPVRLSIL